MRVRIHANLARHWPMLPGLLWWAMATLVAVALIEWNAYAGLGAAVLGGIILGILLFVREPR